MGQRTSCSVDRTMVLRSEHKRTSFQLALVSENPTLIHDDGTTLRMMTCTCICPDYYLSRFDRQSVLHPRRFSTWSRKSQQGHSQGRPEFQGHQFRLEIDLKHLNYLTRSTPTSASPISPDSTEKRKMHVSVDWAPFVSLGAFGTRLDFIVKSKRLFAP